MKVKVKNENANKCLFWHDWKVVKETGKTKYKECVSCGSRMIVSEGEGYQPIDYKWVTRNN